MYISSNCTRTQLGAPQQIQYVRKQELQVENEVDQAQNFHFHMSYSTYNINSGKQLGLFGLIPHREK
jgi:hypothetical protein